MCWEWTSNQLDWTKFLTAEAKEINLPKTKLKGIIFQIGSIYAITNPLLWFQKINADEKDHYKLIIILVQVDLPGN